MSNHQVKIVLLAKFDGDGSQILLENWEEEAILFLTFQNLRSTRKRFGAECSLAANHSSAYHADQSNGPTARIM
jgi:hypothetical protein